MCFIVITDKSTNPLDRFQELSQSTVLLVLDEDKLGPLYQNLLSRMDESIKRKIGDPIKDTEIDKFKADMMPYED